MGAETGKLEKENGKWEKMVNWRNEKDGKCWKSWRGLGENVDL